MGAFFMPFSSQELITIPFDQSVERALVDLRTSYLGGKSLRLYTAGLPAGFQTIPGGTQLAGILIPDPSHNAAVWNNTLNRPEAVLRGTWSDQSADASGTFGCFIVIDPVTNFIVQRGTAGASGSGAQLILSAASVAQGAPFSIVSWTIRHAPLP